MKLKFYLLENILFFMCICICEPGYGTDHPCVARAFAGRSVICVCNATYCDTITRKKPDRGTYIVYTSSKAGARFEKTYGSLMKSNTTRPAPLSLLLYPEIKYQEMKGFGAAITDSAGMNWMSLGSKQLRQNLIDSYFSSEGIEYSCLRVPIGGTDFSTHRYAYNDLPEGDIGLRNFSLSYEDYKYKIPMIKAAMRVSCTPLNILGTTWAPPEWMTVKNNYSTCGRLKMEYYQTLADYHYKFIELYEAQGVPVWGITTTNEPANGFMPFTDFNCLSWTAHDLGLWINNFLGPRIRGSKFKNVKILGVDDRRIYLPLWFTEMLKEYPSVINFLDGVGVHDYNYQAAPPDMLRLVTDRYPDKFIMGTEYSEGHDGPEGEKVLLGSWDRATIYITNIIADMKFGAAGWLDWNICLDEQGGPAWNENYVDSPIIVSPKKGEFYKQPMFYAMGHVSKFIPRGSRRIHVVDVKCETTGEEPNDAMKYIPDSVTFVAFLTPDDTIVVVINNSGNATAIQIHVRKQQAVINIEAKAIVTVELRYDK